MNGNNMLTLRSAGQVDVFIILLQTLPSLIHATFMPRFLCVRKSLPLGEMVSYIICQRINIHGVQRFVYGVKAGK